MANRFEIKLTAVDKATAVVRGVNRAIGRIMAPITKLRIAGGHLSRELGLDRIGKGLVNVGRQTRDVTQRFTSMLAPFGALIGVGSIAGVVALGNAWADTGFKIRQASIETGIAAPKLQAITGASRLWGVEAESLTSSLATLGDTLQDARFGRNIQALSMMRQLGVDFRQTADGGLDVAASFNDIARAISNPKIANDPPVQRVIARAFGLEAALPILRQGPDAIDRLMEKVEATGFVMSEQGVAQAEGFRQSLTMLNLTTIGLRNTIGEKLIPVVQPLLEKFGAWIIANREIIGLKVAEAVDAVANAIARVDWGGVVDGVSSLWQSVERLVNWLGGWENALIAVIAIMNAGAIVSVLSLFGAVTQLGMAIGGTLIKGILSLGSVMTAGIIAPSATAVAKLGAVKLAALGLGKALLGVGAAAAAGYGIGTVISKMTEGTAVGDTIGAGVARTLAFFGNDEAQAAVDRMDGNTVQPRTDTAPAATPFSAQRERPEPAGPASGSAERPAVGQGGLAGRIELFIRGLPEGARAVATGELPIDVRVEQAMPTGFTP